MAETETVDADHDDGIGLIYGVLQLAGAAYRAPATSAAAKALAAEVIREAEREPKRVPAEAGTVARTFNREMDVVLDAANASAGQSTRHERRLMMAEALDRGGLILLDKGTAAQMFADGLALDLARGRIERLEAQVYLTGADAGGIIPTDPAIAAEIAAAGGCCAGYDPGNDPALNANVND